MWQVDLSLSLALQTHQQCMDISLNAAHVHIFLSEKEFPMIGIKLKALRAVN